MMQSPQPQSLRLAPRIVLSWFLLLATTSCVPKPTPKYTVEGLLLELPEGSTAVDMRQLPGETVFDEFPLLIEQIRLPSPVRVQLGKDEVVRRDIAWRITVSSQSEPFRTGALPWVIWVGDKSLIASESFEMNSIVAITFDPNLLAQGGQISVSYGVEPDYRAPIAIFPPLP